MISFKSPTNTQTYTYRATQFSDQFKKTHGIYVFICLQKINFPYLM